MALFVLNAFLFLSLYSCLKDDDKSSQRPKLTLERAKEILEQTGVSILGAQHRDGEEGGDDIGVYMRLGWNNGSEYYHQGLGLDVVEIPILESNLSRTYHIGNGINHADDVNYDSLSGQVAKVLITQQANDTNVNIVILKLSATCEYLQSNDIASNSFGKMDLEFEGLVEYSNLQDSLLKSYLVTSGSFYEVNSVKYLRSTDGDSAIQNQAVDDRWGFCITGWITARPCTGSKRHTCNERSSCSCYGENASCSPPLCIPILEECGGPPAISNPPGSSYGNPGLPGAPSNGWGNNGSGQNPNSGPCRCTKHYIDEFWWNITPDLDAPYGGYWFNINHIVLGPNCKNGEFSSGTYKVYAVPGQASNAYDIKPTVALDYCALDAKSPISACKYKVELVYSANLEFYVVWNQPGPLSFEDQYIKHVESAPTFIFQ